MHPGELGAMGTIDVAISRSRSLEDVVTESDHAARDLILIGINHSLRTRSLLLHRIFQDLPVVKEKSEYEDEADGADDQVSQTDDAADSWSGDEAHPAGFGWRGAGVVEGLEGFDGVGWHGYLILSSRDA
jgi:hypothetical protein